MIASFRVRRLLVGLSGNWRFRTYVIEGTIRTVRIGPVIIAYYLGDIT
jgi:hypothetical protein